MSHLRTLLKKCYLSLPVGLRQRVHFWLHTGYFPRLRSPTTFNEKILKRKLNWNNPLFVTCSDKVAAKAYVEASHKDLVVLENLATGENLEPALLRDILHRHGEVVLKTNHDSGSPWFLNGQTTDEEIRGICQSVNQRLQSLFGEIQSEGWYSQIRPQFLIEKKIQTPPGEALMDYKFHVFNHGGNTEPTVVLHIDFDRFSNHTRSFFDAQLNWLPFSCRYPAVHTTLKKPPHYEQMLEIAKVLATPFSYARVDLFNIEGKILFGELTFAHESGRGRFSDRSYDQWMGKLWTGDPSQ